MITPAPARRVGPVVIAALLFAACDSSSPPVEPEEPDPVSVTISPTEGTVLVGSAFSFTAAVSGGDETTLRTVQWALQPPSGIATFQISGNTITLTGVAPGTVTVTALGPESASANATLRVDAVPIVPATVEVTPDSAGLVTGGTIQLTAVVKDDEGNVLEDEPVTWATADASVATVADGLVTGVGPGTTEITATAGEAVGVTTITVIEALPSGRVAYALADDPSATAYTASAATSLNSTGLPITITRADTGSYRVLFGGQAPAEGQSQFVHVSSYGTDHHWCKLAEVAAQGADLLVTVNCYSPTEAPTDVRFTILMLGDDALPGRFGFGFADQPSTPAAYSPIDMYSSGGQPLVIQRDQNGIYRVNFPGLARPAGGHPETTLVGAVSDDGARCSVNGFASSSVLPVQCIGALDTRGTVDDAPFMVALIEQGQPGRRFAFTTTGIGGVPAQETFNSSGGAVTTVRHGPGRIDVTFAGLGRNGATGTETVQTVSNSSLGAYCKVLKWDASGVDLTASIECYDTAGMPADAEFRVLVMQ